MRFVLLTLRVVLASVLCVSWAPSAIAGAPPDLQRRAPWTTSHVVGSPEPPLPWTTELAFPKLKFDRCLDMAAAPGTDRLFVAEQNGKIFSFVNRRDTTSADLAIDLRKAIAGVQQVYAITFHPNFSVNRYCYICYVKKPGQPDGTHVARFVVKKTDPPIIDASSETTIITWLSGGHNGCCLRFGPDGYLYVSTGDGVGPNPPDTRRTGQDISDLLSSILRLDVDHEDGERHYRIPADNPFVDRKNARPEVFAYGLRNPWRMSFDRQTGVLWVGDVGWELWEMLYRVTPGGNYGWSVMEGPQAIHPEWPRGPTPILPPAIEHPHTESSSITDGLTYYGKRLESLRGTHIYGDYDTGKIWGFRDRQGKIVEHRELADTTHRIVAFSEDLDGNLYLLDHTAGTIHRLIPNPRRDAKSTFPRRLSETGLLAATSKLQPAAGVIAYSVVAEPWADYAVAERMIALPNQTMVDTTAKVWRFPENTVLVKTLSLEMRQGDPASRQRIETQLLHFDGREWQPYTYRWNEQQTDAQLVGAGGEETYLKVVDPDAPGGIRQQLWRFAGRAECQRCHNKWSGPPLGFNVAELNKSARYGSLRVNQLDALTSLGVLSRSPPDAQRVRLADPADEEAALNDRARAYLHINCAHCHRMHAGGSVLARMPFDVPLSESNMLEAEPTQGRFGISHAKVIAAGDPYRSVLLYRMSKLGGGRMPHIGSSEIDRRGVALIHDWIASLGGEVPVVDQHRAEFEDLQRLSKADAGDGIGDAVDRLLATTTGAFVALRAIDEGRIGSRARAAVIERATSVEAGPVRDLFERFVPVEQRVKRLGTAVHPERILAMDGDLDRGRRVFFDTEGVQCKSCHQIGGRGVAVGPDLSKIGATQTRAQLLESILAPSKRIAPEYVTYVVETKGGHIHTGVLVSRSEASVTLKDAQGKLIQIATKEVAQLVPSQQSLMPELQVRDMTAQQVADLLAYLASCK